MNIYTLIITGYIFFFLSCVHLLFSCFCFLFLPIAHAYGLIVCSL